MFGLPRLFPYTGAASFLIGLLQILWAALPLVNGAAERQSLFVKALRESNTGEEWLVTMFLTGALLCFSSLFPRRSLRHIALFLSGIVLLTSFGIFLNAQTVTPVTLALPLLGGYCGFLLVLDAANKKKGLR